MAVESVFNSDFSAILLAEESSDNGTFALSEGVSCDVVRNCEKHQRMQYSLELRALLGGEQ